MNSWPVVGIAGGPWAIPEVGDVVACHGQDADTSVRHKLLTPKCGWRLLRDNSRLF
jgi:hypothetical protein